MARLIKKELSDLFGGGIEMQEEMWQRQHKKRDEVK